MTYEKVIKKGVRCKLCGDVLAWHWGNGGQWLGAEAPRDWMTCNGVPDGDRHVPDRDDRFPQAANSYACDHCKAEDHFNCAKGIYTKDWSCPCACYEAAVDAHPHTVTIKVSADDYANLKIAASWEGRTGNVGQYLVDHAMGRIRKGC